MAFVDMRMPPGWGGIRTIQEMWQVDPQLEVVICTAYSDHTWGEVFARLGKAEQLLILKKPFDPVEVKQLAASLTHKWELGRQARLRIESLRSSLVEREEALDLLGHQNQAILEWVGQPVIALDRERRIQLLNAAAAEALAGPVKSFAGKAFHQVIHRTHLANSDCESCHWNSWEEIDALTSAGVSSDRFDRANGEQTSVEFIVSRTRGSDGLPAGAVIMFSAVVESRNF